MSFELTDTIINAAVTAGAVYGVVKTELRFLRRDTDIAHKRIDEIVKGRCPSWTNLNQHHSDNNHGDC